MDGDMDVRDATPADAEAITAVARASWHAAYDELLGAKTVDATVDSWYALESLRESIADAAGTDAGTNAGADVGTDPAANGAESVFLVAERAGDVVGFTNAGPSRDGEWDPEIVAFLARLYVHPDYWGAGIGTALTARLARRLRDAGYDRVWLEVFAENEPGRRFYESLGFEQVRREQETFGGKDLTTLHLETTVDALVAVTSGD